MAQLNVDFTADKENVEALKRFFAEYLPKNEVNVAKDRIYVGNFYLIAVPESGVGARFYLYQKKVCHDESEYVVGVAGFDDLHDALRHLVLKQLNYAIEIRREAEGLAERVLQAAVCDKEDKFVDVKHALHRLFPTARIKVDDTAVVVGQYTICRDSAGKCRLLKEDQLTGEVTHSSWVDNVHQALWQIVTDTADRAIIAASHAVEESLGITDDEE